MFRDLQVAGDYGERGYGGDVLMSCVRDSENSGSTQDNSDRGWYVLD